MKANILITGGAGYIGTLLTNRLVREGYKVTIYDNFTYGAKSIHRLHRMLTDNITPAEALSLNEQYDNLPKADFEIVEADIRNKESLKKTISKGNFDYIFHFAGLVGKFLCESKPEQSKEINYGGTKNIIDAALECNNIPRIIYNSSSSVYHSSQDPASEDSPIPDFKDLNKYCQNKILSEQYILEAAKNKDFEYIILRPATVGGLSARMRLSILLNHFTYAALKQRRLSLKDPKHYRAAIDINDLIDSYMAILNSEQWHNGIFNIGNQDLNLTKKQFTDNIAGIISPFPFNIVITRDKIGDTRNLTISSELFKKEYGFAASKSFEETITPLVELLNNNSFVFSHNNSTEPHMVELEFLNISRDEFKILLS